MDNIRIHLSPQGSLLRRLLSVISAPSPGTLIYETPKGGGREHSGRELSKTGGLWRDRCQHRAQTWRLVCDPDESLRSSPMSTH